MKKTPAKSVPAEQKHSVVFDEKDAIENGQESVPVNGFSLAIGDQRGSVVLARKRKGRSRRGGSRSKSGVISRLPPPITTTLAVPFRIRTLNASTATSVTFTRASIAGMLGVVVTVANTTVRGICGTYRLKRIIAWPAAGGQINVSWNTSGGAEMALVKDKVKTNTLPVGITEDVGMVFRPPKRSVLGMWQTPSVNGTDQMLQISATAGSVFDWEGVFTLTNQYFGETASIVSGTLAQFYYLPPDGTTTHLFTPQGLPTGF